MESEEYNLDSDSDVDADEDGLRDLPSSSSSSPPSSSSPLASSPSFNKPGISSRKPNRNKSMFKTSRRLSGVPNMILNSMTNLQDLSPEDLVKVTEMIAKFPVPPDKIHVPPSSVSNMKSSVTNYFKGFFSGGSSSSGKDQSPKPS